MNVTKTWKKYVALFYYKIMSLLDIKAQPILEILAFDYFIIVLNRKSADFSDGPGYCTNFSSPKPTMHSLFLPQVTRLRKRVEELSKL